MWMWRGLRAGTGAARGAVPPLARSPVLRSLSSTVARTVKLPQQLDTILAEFRESKSLAKATKSRPELMKVRVQRVLLLCSDYDSYTFEEDGMLGELMHSEYAQQNLRKPPVIERVTSVEHAMEMLQTQEFDLLISLLRTQGESLNLESFVEAVKKHDPKIPILLLALNPSELLSLDSRVDESLRFNVDKRLTWEAGGESATATTEANALAQSWLWPFLWQGNLSLFTAMFKAVEDRLNAVADVKVGAQVILLVEDNVKFYSMYMPMVYAELIKQSAALEDESMTQAERLNRMQSRPKVLLCTNYEEAVDIFGRYKDQTMAIISDVAFFRGGQWDADAGLHFIKHVKEQRPDVEVLMQSSEELMREQAAELDVAFLHKSSPSLHLELRNFFRRTLLFGPLRFTSESGAVVAEASNITQLMKVYANLPEDVIDRTARTNTLSKWFRARAEPALATHFTASRYPDDFLPHYAGAGFKSEKEMLRHWVITSMFSLRNRLTGAVSDASESDAMTPIVRVGKGSLGGKGRGFRLLHNLMDAFDIQTALMPQVKLEVPQCLILATDVFDRFIESNELIGTVMTSHSDDEIQSLFDAATLPVDAMDALKKYAERTGTPIAVRSSSLFEDAFQQPFAGVYESYMLSNTEGGIPERVNALASAVKRVYASVFSLEARRYAEASRLTVANEKMAVIIQAIAGKEHSAGVFSPSLAGVANAIDFYPRPHTTTDDGCATMSYGFGSSVVDGNSALTWSLGDPSYTVGSPSDFMVLSLGDGVGVNTGGVVVSDSALNKVGASQLGAFGLMKTVASSKHAPIVELQTKDAHGQQVVFTHRSTPHEPAPHAPPAELTELTLQQVVRGDAFPLSPALSFFLQLGTAALACPVEVEFAINLRKSIHEVHELHILQIRPMPQLISDSKSTKALRFSYLPSTQHAFVTSKHALGHGRFNNITDVIYVSPDAFTPENSDEIAREIGELNAVLRKKGKKYMLVGPGRWGTRDKARGIPVNWSQIDASQFIIETSLSSASGGTAVPPSQGAHFFQNIMSFGLGYMTVDQRDASKEEDIDYAWLDAQEKVSHSAELPALRYVQHVTLPEELEVVCDGLSRRGVIMKPGKPFDTYVAQVDAMMAITSESGGMN